MALHNSIESMVAESLPEYIDMARLALNTPKPTGGFYGYPAALLLFSIVDAIGSYYRGNRSFHVMIENKQRLIDGDKHRHFFVLNSALYGQNLTEKEICALYEYFRNPLTHNAGLLPGVVLDRGRVGDPVFYPTSNGKVEGVNLAGFLEVSAKAVQLFLTADGKSIGSSHQAQMAMKKTL